MRHRPITRQTQTVSKHTQDNTVLFSLQNTALSWLFRPLELRDIYLLTYLLTYTYLQTCTVPHVVWMCLQTVFLHGISRLLLYFKGFNLCCNRIQYNYGDGCNKDLCRWSRRLYRSWGGVTASPRSTHLLVRHYCRAPLAETWRNSGCSQRSCYKPRVRWSSLLSYHTIDTQIKIF